MSDNPEFEAETVKRSESNAATDTAMLQNKIETDDASVKEDESVKLEEASVEDACKCSDITDAEKTLNQDINVSADLVNDCKHPQPADSAVSIPCTVNIGENKPSTPDNELKELNVVDHVDDKAPEKPKEIKTESEETSIKVEVTDGDDKLLDSQQTRNLFETVGLVLRSNTSQAGSEEGALDENAPNQEAQDSQDSQGNGNLPAVSTPCVSEPLQAATPSYCEFCGFPAANPDIYSKHMKFHDRTNTTYACFICGVKYKKRDVAVEHYRLNHDICEDSLKKCQSCKFITSDEATMKEHIRKHFLIRPHACGICYQTFATLYNHQRHMEKHTVDERTGVGYTRPVSKRRRGSSVCQGKAINSSKRSRNSSKVDETSKPPSDENKSSKPKPVRRKSTVESEQEESKPMEMQVDIPPKNYFVLPTKTINLVCSFCETTTLSKRELSQHLLSTHGDEIITLKPF